MTTIELVRLVVELAIIPAAAWLWKKHMDGNDRKAKLAQIALSVWQQVEVIAERENLFTGQKWYRWVHMFNEQVKTQKMKPTTGGELAMLKTLIDGYSAKDKLARMNGTRRPPDSLTSGSRPTVGK